jgi:hypothetical protein
MRFSEVSLPLERRPYKQLIQIFPTDPLHILKEWASPFPKGSNGESLANSTDSTGTIPQPQGADICYSSVTQEHAHTKGLGRARSLRTERRREKFAKVLSGKVKDRGGSVDSGKPGTPLPFTKRHGLRTW